MCAIQQQQKVLCTQRERRDGFNSINTPKGTLKATEEEEGRGHAVNQA